MQHALHYPVAFIILPVFALVNTAIIIPENALEGLLSDNSIGIIAGLIVGKFIGIMLVSWLAIKTGLAGLPQGVSWKLLSGAALLAGIGFTMSIFITNLAFNDQSVIVASKLAILVASFTAAIAGLMVLFNNKKTMNN